MFNVFNNVELKFYFAQLSKEYKIRSLSIRINKYSIRMNMYIHFSRISQIMI